MVSDRFVTVRWNNILSVGLGLPSLVFVVVALSSSTISDFAGFVSLAILGSVY